MYYKQYMQCLDVEIRCKQWKMDGNKMDSIVIMDFKKIFFVNNNL